MFLMLGGFFIISENRLALNSGGDVDKFFSLYSRWIDDLSLNGKTVVGHVIKMDWLPGEEGI